MTIPSPNRTSRRSNIVLASQIVSAASRMPGLIARHEHRHSGIALMTPHTVHYGGAQELTGTRCATLDAAFLAHPEGFKRTAPRPPKVPLAAWINAPKRKESQTPINLDACSLNVNAKV
jgi:hypothetical protein